jgi:2-oxoglutarate dehydrogenase complex dehydrogenase (E1) component-like enzyme
VLYQAISRRKSVREGYLEHLLKLGGLSREEADQIATKRRDLLEKELSESQSPKPAPPPEMLKGIWANYKGGLENVAGEPATGIDKEKLVSWLHAQSVLPEDFHPNPKLKKLLQARAEMAAGQVPLDWAAAESLALNGLVQFQRAAPEYLVAKGIITENLPAIGKALPLVGLHRRLVSHPDRRSTLPENIGGSKKTQHDACHQQS